MMKRLLYLVLVLLSVAGCKKTENLVFDERPEIRMQKSIEEVKSMLTGSTNGWVASLPTQAGGGYGFYMAFDQNEVVKMYGDLTDPTATSVGSSTYRVKANLGAELIFDTYNYISLLGDPNPSSFGGATGTGLKSDVEFIFDRSTADSIVFIGKKYRQELRMVKATAAQKTAYETAGLQAAMVKLKEFFVNNKNPYFELISGSSTNKVGIAMNATNSITTGKRLDFTGILADGKTVTSSVQKFAFTLDGVTILNSGIAFQGVTFVSFKWKDATVLAAYDSAGKEYIIKNSVSPLAPIDLLWGVKFNQMFSAYRTIYPGTSTSGTAILNYFHDNVTSRALTGFAFVAGDITLVWDRVNKRLTTNARVAQAANPAGGWVTSTVYDYTMDANNVYKFTLRSAASGGYATNIVTELQKFLLNNRVTFHFHVDGANLYGKMKSVEDPSIEMTFVLR